MSQYIEFFIRKGNESYINVGSYSRNNPIFGLLQYEVPYEKVEIVTGDLSNFIRLFDHEIERLNKAITKEEALKTNIISANNSLEEKVETLIQTDAYIESLDEDLKATISQREFLYFLENIVNENELQDIEVEVYAGIEPGDPNKEKKVNNYGDLCSA